jgi:hypothetical protein
MTHYRHRSGRTHIKNGAMTAGAIKSNRNSPTQTLLNQVIPTEIAIGNAASVEKVEILDSCRCEMSSKWTLLVLIK